MSTPTKSNNGLILWQSVMAGLTSLAAAGIWTDVIGERFAGVFMAIVAALHAGTAVYVAAFKPVETPEHMSPSPG